MWVSSLRIEGLRSLGEVALDAAAGLNVFVGGNGAGKTSILEGVHCLATGRSFRSGQVETLIQRGRDRFSVSARVAHEGRERQAGFVRDRDGWRGRIDGNDVQTLGALARALAVLCFEPGSHELVAGPAEVRRRLLDLGLFHVEPEYLELWRRYQRVLRQRNAALRQYASEAQWVAWERLLAVDGERLSALRSDWTTQLERKFRLALGAFLPEFESTGLRWRRGWDENLSLEQVLQDSRQRDRDLGYTVAGPHRGDLKLQLGPEMGRFELSRGQQKMVALALQLATAAALRAAIGWSPLILLDDLPSELDLGRQQLCLQYARSLGSQLWVTGTVAPAGVDPDQDGTRCFRVEGGRVTGLRAE